MNKRLTVAGLIVGLWFSLAPTCICRAADNQVKIGVLAKRGPERCLERWSPLAAYLSAKIPGKAFVIVPTDFDQIYSFVEKGEVDFILANPSFYVELERWYGASRIVTLRNRRLGGVYTEFAGVVFCKANRGDIRQLSDLKGKTFMAVQETSFGGWRMAWRHLKEKGIDPYRDFKGLRFGGTHDAVVYAVRDGKVDAGTVRSDTLERMYAEGEISLRDFYVIHEHGAVDEVIPFVHSTRAYPEWPLAKVKHTPDDLAKKVASALLNMHPDCPAAIASGCAGWTIPLNYQSVHECLKELKLGPYKDLGEMALADVFRKYWDWILAIAFFLAGTTGACIFILKLNQNIRAAHVELQSEVEERERTAEALQESQERYRKLIKITSEGYWLVNPQLETIDVNQALCDMLGYTREEILGKTPFDFVDDKNRKIFIAQTSKIPHILHRSYEITLRKKTGEEVHTHLNATTLMDKSGTVQGAFALVTDITERKRADDEILRAKEEWERTFNAINEIVTIHDAQMRIVRLNLAAVQEFTCDPKEVIGRHCYEMFRGKTEPCPECPEHQSTLDHASHTAEIEHHGLGKTFLVTCSPIFEDSGTFTGTIHSAKDITQQKKLETQFRQAEKMEAIGTLAGGIAHDFNNILGAIMGYAELAQLDMSEGSKHKAYLAQVLKASNRAKDLVNQILTFSRQSEGEQRPLQVTLVIKEALKLLRASIPTTIKIDQEITKEPATVLADPTQIHQVIMNLCTNAAHAMQKSGGVLGVKLASVDLDADAAAQYPDLKPGPYIRLAVGDTGHGIVPGIKEQIFDPFFTTKGPGEGTGMGLSVVHGIVKSHGGAITVYSEPDKGTTFHVLLPRIKGEERPETDKAEVLPTGSQRILFVDDEQVLVRVGEQMLGRLGYEVVARTSSIEALEVFRAQPDKFDLIITDQTMPNMTGEQLARKVMGIRSDIPVILCTGYSRMVSENRVKSMGIRAFVMKPVVMRELAETTRRVLDQKNEQGG